MNIPKPTKPNDEELTQQLIEQVERYANTDSDIIANDLQALITKREHLAELRGRIDEANGVVLYYGHRVAETYAGGNNQSISERITSLQQQLEEAEAE